MPGNRNQPVQNAKSVKLCATKTTRKWNEHKENETLPDSYQMRIELGALLKIPSSSRKSSGVD